MYLVEGPAYSRTIPAPRPIATTTYMAPAISPMEKNMPMRPLPTAAPSLSLEEVDVDVEEAAVAVAASSTLALACSRAAEHVLSALGDETLKTQLVSKSLPERSEV